jgi:hypothetical protein
MEGKVEDFKETRFLNIEDRIFTLENLKDLSLILSAQNQKWASKKIVLEYRFQLQTRMAHIMNQGTIAYLILIQY